jgi:hypothetical protein
MSIEIEIADEGRDGIMEIGKIKISSLSDNLSNYLDKFKYKKGDPRHEKAEVVNEILKVVEIKRDYNYGFWLSKLKRFEESGGSFWLIRDWLKQIDSYPGNFNKGAILTNKFKKFNDEYKKARQTNTGATL